MPIRKLVVLAFAVGVGERRYRLNKAEEARRAKRVMANPQVQEAMAKAATRLKEKPAEPVTEEEQTEFMEQIDKLIWPEGKTWYQAALHEIHFRWNLLRWWMLSKWYLRWLPCLITDPAIVRY